MAVPSFSIGRHFSLRQGDANDALEAAFTAATAGRGAP